jgi:tetratricopeptide (TPR) repeat protein
VAKTGRAEVLKSQGEFEHALAAYDEVIRQHPENVVAKNGRAEILKAQGEFKDALAAYDEVIRQHPEDVVAKTGRAEILKAQGEFKEALAAYDEVIRQHPENVVAKNGRAEVLTVSGELYDALTAYNEVRLRYPSNTIARNGRSSVLAALRKYDEALEDLPVDNAVGLQDWIGLHIRGMVLIQMKRFEDAIQIFQRGATENPFPSSAVYFQAALAVALIRQEKYGDARNVLSDIDAPSLKPQIDVLRLHTSGEEKEFEEAKAAFQDLTPKPWSISDELLDELHRRYILKVEPKQSNEWVFDKEVECLLLVANQQASVSSYAH